MGLDNIIYKSVPVKDKKLSKYTSQLIGGMLSDSSNSFRGKVYDPVFSEITGYSLYDSDAWTYDDKQQIVNNLVTFAEKHRFNLVEELAKMNYDNWYEWTEEDFNNILEVMKLVLEKNWTIHAWF